MSLKHALVVIVAFLFSLAFGQAVVPAEVYDGGFNDTQVPIRIRVGTGGAGQSGILKGKKVDS